MRLVRWLAEWGEFAGKPVVDRIWQVQNKFPAMTHLKPFLAVIGVAAIGASAASAALVINPGFETLESTLGRPSSYGDWGDNVSQIVSAENGVTPRDGSRMLKFIATGPDGPDVGTGGSVYQLLDLSSIAASIASGQALVTASAFFNRAFAGAETDTQFVVSLTAYAGSPAGFPAFPAPLATMTVSLFSDGDALTWELLETSLLLPTDTTYVSLLLAAVENVVNETASPEFDGHYADSVVGIGQIPEPSGWLLVVSGAAIGLMRRGRGRVG
jgi:hypothetical protein